MSKNEKGFGSMEILLVIVVVGLLAVVGWLFLDRYTNNEAATTDDSSRIRTDDPKENAEKIDETANWLNYTSPRGTYSIKVPDGWNLDDLSSNGIDGLWAWNSEAIQHAANTEATVTEIKGGRGGSSAAFALIYGYVDGNTFNIEGSVRDTYRTDNGYDVSQYYFVEPGREGMYPAEGTISYVYDIKSQTKRVTIKHDILAGETDQSSLIEEMIKTLKIHQ